MFPWIYDFKWQPVHLVFLSVFFTVLGMLVTLLTLAIVRTVRTVRQRRTEAIRWAEDFHDLPESSRICRHELMGEVARRTCDRGFDCRTCEDHAKFPSASRVPAMANADPGSEEIDILGFRMPADRLYHRGHAWARPEPDGTVTVGIDDLASRLIGKPDKVILPTPGSRLDVNGTAWRIRKGTAEARILSPVDGVVVEQGGGNREWYLKVQPVGDTFDTRHLLSGPEVRPWMLREVERLHASLCNRKTGVSLPDGGQPIEDISSAVPETRRDTVLGEMLLEP